MSESHLASELTHMLSVQDQRHTDHAGDPEENLFEDSPSYQIFKPRHDPNTDALMSAHEFAEKYGEAAPAQWSRAKERSPPFLETQYRLGHGTELNLDKELKAREPKYFLEAGSSRKLNAACTCLAWACLPLGGPCLYCALVSHIEVPVGHVAPLEDGQGGFLLAGQGVHRIVSPFITQSQETFNYAEGLLSHGDWCLVVIDQGFVGLAMDKGQPILLPPGFHQWKSTTLKFVKTIDLNLPVIFLGPYTLLTVDEGYCAVTQDNGRQVIKKGGEVHLLMHRNHKFEKFLSQKIQTDNLARIEVITADNVLMLTDATVNWKIADPELAARNAAETMHKREADTFSHHDPQANQSDITKLRNDVLQQGSASLSSFIGTVNYSDSFSPNALVQTDSPTTAIVEDQGSILFDVDRMSTAVEHANAVTLKYGVEIISINIISAKPSDPALMTSLAQGAVAAAEALQLETTAQGRAKAAKIEADAAAKAVLIEARAVAGCLEMAAKADSGASEVRAGGARKAADLIATSAVAVELARIDKTGAAIKDTSTMFFGANPSNVGGLLSKK